MTDAEFAAAIDFASLSKNQLLELAGDLAGKIDGYPVAFRLAIEGGALTPKQAYVLDNLRKSKGDAFVENAALITNLTPAAAATATQVKDWINARPGATEAEIKAAFPPIQNGEFREIMRFLTASKQIKSGFKV